MSCVPLVSPVPVETGRGDLREEKPSSCLSSESEPGNKKLAEETDVEGYSQTHLMAVLDW
jgi:hypothetical protein